MHDDSTSHDIWLDKVREAIHAGRVPNRPPDRVWKKRGAGAHCTICGLPVKHGELGFGMEFIFRYGPAARDHHVHVHCLAAFESQLKSIETRSETSPALSGRNGSEPAN